MKDKIINISKGVIDYVPTDGQTKMINFIRENKKCIILNGRQTGSTTSILHYLTKRCINESLVVGIKNKRNLISSYKRIIEVFECCDDIESISQTSINFKNGGKILFFNDFLRIKSIHINVIWIDDAAWTEFDVESLFYYPEIILSSTGIRDGIFCDMAINAKKGSGKFAYYGMDYEIDDSFNMKEYMTVNQIRREYTPNDTLKNLIEWKDVICQA